MSASGTCAGIFLSVVLFTALPAFAVEHENEQHEAHVHGEAELLVAVDSRVMEIEFHSPAINLVGFEHPPQNPLEIHQLTAAGKLLRKADMLFTLPAEAGCTLQKIGIEIPFQDEATTKHTGHDDESHADFAGYYRYECQKPSRLGQFRVNLFELFPYIEKIKGQGVSGQGQQAFELYPGQETVEL